MWATCRINQITLNNYMRSICMAIRSRERERKTKSKQRPRKTHAVWRKESEKKQRIVNEIPEMGRGRMSKLMQTIWKIILFESSTSLFSKVHTLEWIRYSVETEIFEDYLPTLELSWKFSHWITIIHKIDHQEHQKKNSIQVATEKRIRKCYQR